MKTFEDLRVWQRSIELADMIHRLSASFPKSELFGMTAQVRGAANSIPCNIAEGQGRSTNGEWIQFLGYARGSLYELRTHLTLCMRFGYVSPEECASLEKQAAKVGQDLNGLINYVKNKAEKKR